MSESRPPSEGSPSLSALGPWGLPWMLRPLPQGSFPGHCLGNPLALASTAGWRKNSCLQSSLPHPREHPQKASPGTQQCCVLPNLG